MNGIIRTCRAGHCGRSGNFPREQEGYCSRCYEEVQSFSDYYERKIERAEKVMPYMAWFFLVVAFMGIITCVVKV